MSSLPPTTTTTPADDIPSHNDISSPTEEKSRPSNRERRQQRAQVRAQFTSEHRPKQNNIPSSISIPSTITRTVDIDATWKFYHDMGNPKMIVAPMVNQSELAFRVLTRRYKADLCYTPMLHAGCFSRDAAYRAEHLQTADIDTPTFAQFCANDPQTLLTAALYAQDYVTAIDINFGCPQGIAKRGHYGSFLLSNPTLMCSLVSILFQNLRIPVTCKIRVLDRDDDTIAMCKRLQEAGCSLLTVHGRTKEQLKDKVGTCNFDIIKKIKQSISIPVFANGGIENLADIHRCLEYTGVDGVMTSEAILGNPTIFCGYEADPVGISQEYLDICKIYPTDHSAIRAHLFKFLYKQLTVFPNIRTRLATDHDFDTIIDELKAEEAKCDPTELSARYAAIPTWYRRHLTYVGNQHVNVEQETNRTTTTEEESEDLSCMFGGCEES